MNIDFNHIPGFVWVLVISTAILIAVGCTGTGKPVERNATQDQAPAQQPPSAAPPTAAPPVSTPPSMGMAVTVTMSAGAFTPREIRAMPGDAITWTNGDQVPHTVSVDPGNAVTGGPDSGTDQPSGISPGQTWTWKVPENATVGTTWYYHCRFHGRPGDGKTVGTGMAGAIIVVAAG
jgi:plastocyanin